MPRSRPAGAGRAREGYYIGRAGDTRTQGKFGGQKWPPYHGSLVRPLMLNYSIYKIQHVETGYKKIKVVFIVHYTCSKKGSNIFNQSYKTQNVLVLSTKILISTTA